MLGTDVVSRYVTIYIGNPHKTFVMKQKNLWHSPVLEKSISQDPDIGPYVMLPMLLSIDADDFETVAGLMCDTSFNCSHPLRIAKAYVTARKLQMGFVGQVCWRRFRRALLEPPTKDLLGGMEEILRRGVEDRDVRWKLLNYVAEHFWDVIRDDMESLTTLLKADKTFTRAVFDEVTVLLQEGGSSSGSKKRAPSAVQ